MTSLKSVLAREETDDAGALLDLAIDVLACVRSTQKLPVSFRKGGDGKAFGQIFLCSGSELTLSLRVGFNKLFEAFFGVGTVVGVENDSDGRGDPALEVLFSDLFLCVLLKMELATMPRCAV